MELNIYPTLILMLRYTGKCKKSINYGIKRDILAMFKLQQICSNAFLMGKRKKAIEKKKRRQVNCTSKI